MDGKLAIPRVRAQNYKEQDITETKSRLSEMTPIGYRGVISADADGNELRLSSIDDKDTQPICILQPEWMLVALPAIY